MNIQDGWEKALGNTEIIRTRVQGLLTFETTTLPYILLSESSLNMGDTVVRKGEVLIEKPSLILPSALPQFEGFDFQKEPNFNEDILTNFLLVRGAIFPSLQYNNKTYSVDIYESGLKEAIQHYLDILERKEDVHTGLVTGAEDCWQFSVLIFICTQIAKTADTDIKKLLEDIRKKGKLS